MPYRKHMKDTAKIYKEKLSPKDKLEKHVKTAVFRETDPRFHVVGKAEGRKAGDHACGVAMVTAGNTTPGALSEGFAWEASCGQSPPERQVDLVPGAALSLPVQLGRH